jgi:hypothetical protein
MHLRLRMNENSNRNYLLLLGFSPRSRYPFIESIESRNQLFARASISSDLSIPTLSTIQVCQASSLVLL